MSRSVVQAIFGVTAFVLISRVLGMIREIVIADKFGTSPEYDLYLIAIMLPALVYGVLNFAFYFLLVPYLTRHLGAATDSADSTASPHMWAVFNGTMAASVVASLLIVLVAPVVMKIWGSGYGAEDFAQIVFYARIVAVIVVLGTLEAFLRALLNSRGQFSYPAAGWVMYNIAFISAVLFGYQRLGVGALALAVVAGTAVQSLFLLARVYGLKGIGRYRFGLSRPALQAVWGTAGVLVIIEILNRAYFMIDRFFALPLGEGVVSALNYSYVLVQLPDSIVGFAIGSVLFQLFSEKDSEGNSPKFLKLYADGISAGLMVALPVTVFVFLNAHDVVRLVFFRGSFDMTSLTMTAAALKMHAPAILALVVVSTSIRACYARSLELSVLMATVPMLLTKIVASWLLADALGYAGITLATSISQLGFALLLFLIVKRQAGQSGLGTFGANLLKIGLAGGVALALAVAVSRLWIDSIAGNDFSDALIRISLSGLVIMLCYTGLVWRLGLAGFLRRFGRN